MHVTYAPARVDDLGTRSQWVGKGKQSALIYLDNYKQAMSITGAATVDFLYVTLTLNPFIRLNQLVVCFLCLGLFSFSVTPCLCHQDVT